MIKFKKMYILRILFLFHVILSYSQIGYSGKITYQYDLDEISKSDNAMEQKIANTFFENLKNNKTETSRKERKEQFKKKAQEWKNELKTVLNEAQLKKMRIE